jgi:hypothetical protein
MQQPLYVYHCCPNCGARQDSGEGACATCQATLVSWTVEEHERYRATVRAHALKSLALACGGLVLCVGIFVPILPFLITLFAPAAIVALCFACVAAAAIAKRVGYHFSQWRYGMRFLKETR